MTQVPETVLAPLLVELYCIDDLPPWIGIAAKQSIEVHSQCSEQVRAIVAVKKWRDVAHTNLNGFDFFDNQVVCVCVRPRFIGT